MSTIDLSGDLSGDLAERPIPQLSRQGLEARALKSGVLTGLTWLAAVLAAVPLPLLPLN